VLDRVPEDQRENREQRAQPQLERCRDPEMLGPRLAARDAVRDRPRQQLLDRPVEDRDDDEHRRPQQRDATTLEA